jgi:flotillin
MQTLLSLHTSGNKGSIAEQVTEAALNYRANAPVVDSLLQELGLVDGNNGGLIDLVKGNSPLLSQSKAPSDPTPNNQAPNDGAN